MFPPLSINRGEDHAQCAKPTTAHAQSEWKQFVATQPTPRLQPLGPQPELSVGDLIIHSDCKVFGRSETRSICKLFKITNAHHHNVVRFSASDILVPGPLIVAAMLCNAERDIGDVLHEEYPVRTNINKVNPGDQIGTITYVASNKRLDENPGLEEVTLRHLGIKNVDLEWLLELGVPRELFSGGAMKPAEYESLCASLIPLLYRKIACQAVRKIIRVSPAAPHDGG